MEEMLEIDSFGKDLLERNLRNKTKLSVKGTTPATGLYPLQPHLLYTQSNRIHWVTSEHLFPKVH